MKAAIIIAALVLALGMVGAAVILTRDDAKSQPADVEVCVESGERGWGDPGCPDVVYEP